MPICDVIIVGAGLAGSLALYRLSQTHPQLKILLIDSNAKIGGDHTWSFHSTDVSPGSMQWLQPLLSKTWEEQSVLFPAHTRKFASRYHSIRSERLHQIVTKACGENFLGNCEIARLEPHRVYAVDGRTWEAHSVIDARGFEAFREDCVAYQKFVGWDVTLARPHGLSGPVIMDATVAQEEGYRFIYLLPWDAWSVLIEDTRYSDSPAVDRAKYKEEIAKYAQTRDWNITSWDREEVGVLPIPLRERYLQTSPRKDIPAIGVRADLFHPTTGYSLPDAVRTVEELTMVQRWDPREISQRLANVRRERKKASGFYRLLNQWLFWGAHPAERYRVLERFYTLDSDLIERFYAGQSTWKDRAKILLGKPPIPMRRAVQSLGRAWLEVPHYG